MLVGKFKFKPLKETNLGVARVLLYPKPHCLKRKFCLRVHLTSMLKIVVLTPDETNLHPLARRRAYPNLISKMYALNQGCMSHPISWSMAAMLRDVVIVVRTRPRAVPLALINHEQFTGSYEYGAAAGPPLINTILNSRAGCL